MSELDKFKRLAESQKKEKAKTEGKLETLYEALGEEGFTSLSSAEEDMTLLMKKITKMKNIFNNKLDKFKDEHAGELSETN